MDKESKINWKEALEFFRTLLDHEEKSIKRNKRWLKTINRAKWKAIEEEIKKGKE
jgi:hypothetical protein